MEEIRLSRRNVRPTGSYGVDAQRLLPVLALLFIANLVQGAMSGKLWPFLGAVVILACAGLGFYASRRRKFLVDPIGRRTEAVRAPNRSALLDPFLTLIGYRSLLRSVRAGWNHRRNTIYRSGYGCCA